jgi:hypothetical protein
MHHAWLAPVRALLWEDLSVGRPLVNSVPLEWASGHRASGYATIPPREKMRRHGGENPHAKPCMAWATDPARIEREDRWTGHRPLGGNEETGDERKAAREATDASRELLLSSAAIRARWILHPFHSPVTTDHQTGFSWNSMAGRGRRRHPGRFLLLDHETSLSDPSLYDDRSIDAI